MAKKNSNENNFKMSVDGSILTIEVDLDEDLGDSNSGRSVIVGRSEEFEQVPGHKDVAVQAFVVRRKERENKNGKSKKEK